MPPTAQHGAAPGGRSTDRGTRAISVAALFMVLAGLFAMHGLSDHGAEDMTGLPPVSAGSTPHLGSAVRFQAPGSIAGARADSTVDTTAHRPAAHETPMALTDTGAMTAMGLCLAVLAGGLLLLALLASRSSNPSFVRVSLRRLPDIGVGRDRSPPSLTQLSICRC